MNDLIIAFSHNKKDFAVLMDQFNLLNYLLAQANWNKETSKEFLKFSTKNIERCFNTYRKYTDDKSMLEETYNKTMANLKNFITKSKKPHEKSD